MVGADGRPTQKTLRQMLVEWNAYRLQTVHRRSQHRLGKVLDRIHVLEGRMLVLLNVDEVIRIIRAADDPGADLIAAFKLTERQAEDILEMRLRQLARLEAFKVEQDLEARRGERAELLELLENPASMKKLIIKEIEGDAKQHGDARRTLIKASERASVEVAVVDEPVTVIFSTRGWVRARTGHGHDWTQFTFKEGDSLQYAREVRTVDQAVFLDTRGRAYAVPVAQLPGARGDGVPAPSLLDALAFGVHPPFAVDQGGHYLGVLDEALVMREIRALADSMSAAPLDPRAVVGATRDDWEALVGAWNDEELAVGAAKAQRGRTRIPGLQRSTETIAERSYRGRVPCSDRDSDTRCIALGRVERLANEARGDVLSLLDEAMSADFAREGLSGRVVDFSLEYAHELVVEPETLLPRRFVTRRTSGLVIETDDGKRTDVVQIDRLERQFTPRGR
jgi:hypothetical protein